MQPDDQSSNPVDKPTDGSSPWGNPADDFEQTAHPLVYAADVDGDGDADIMVEPPGRAPYTLKNEIGPEADPVFERFAEMSVVPTTVALGDVDGDGSTDVVVGHLSGVRVFYNDGFWSEQKIGTTVSDPHVIIMDDVDGNGHTDLIIRDSKELVVVPSVGGQLGSHFLSWPKLGDSAALGIGDFDLTNTSLEIITLNQDLTMGIIAHDGNTWQAIRQLSTIKTTGFKVQDLNGDGLDDIYVETAAGEHLWLQGDGQGNVVAHEEGDPPVASVTPEIEPSAGAAEPAITGNEEADESTPEPMMNAPMPMAPMYNSMVPFDMPAPEPAPEPEDPGFDFQADPDLTAEATTDADIFHGSNWMDIYFGCSDDDYINGHRGTDILFGNGGDDTILGGKGGDIMFGGNGDDLMAGQKGSDIMFGDSGDDLMYGGNGDDIMFGDSGDDTLLGGTGADLIYGDQGDDIVFGDMGRDTLLGKAGNDTFHYTSAAEGNDIIGDFSSGEDSFEFEFGTARLHVTIGEYSGDADMSGDGFVWEQTDDHTGNLYYDADLDAVGGETLIAEVHLDGDTTEVTVDDITVV